MLKYNNNILYKTIWPCKPTTNINSALNSNICFLTMWRPGRWDHLCTHQVHVISPLEILFHSAVIQSDPGVVMTQP